MPRWTLPTWLRWGGVRLPTPDGPAAEPPSEDGIGLGGVALVAVLLLAVGAGVAAVVPSGRVLVSPGEVGDAAEVLDVDVPDDRAAGPVTGTYLQPRRNAHASTLSALLARAPGGDVVEDAVPAGAGVLDPIESAVLVAVGVAPARSSAEQMGFTLTVDDATPRGGLGAVLLAHDTASPDDVAAGRRILALGVVGVDGLLGCPADAAASLAAADEMGSAPDVVVMGEGCPGAQAVRDAGIALVQSRGTPDVFFALAGT